MIHLVLDKKSTMYDEYLQEKIYNFLDKTFVIPKKFEYNILEVGESYIMRPDLISKDAYGDPIYSDIICKINGINPFELNEGMILILPTPECIGSFLQEAPSREREKESTNNTIVVPTAKSTKSKRKANEAVLGDKRFNIDPINGVIIY